MLLLYSSLLPIRTPMRTIAWLPSTSLPYHCESELLARSDRSSLQQPSKNLKSYAQINLSCISLRSSPCNGSAVLLRSLPLVIVSPLFSIMASGAAVVAHYHRVFTCYPSLTMFISHLTLCLRLLRSLAAARVSLLSVQNVLSKLELPQYVFVIQRHVQRSASDLRIIQ